MTTHPLESQLNAAGWTSKPATVTATGCGPLPGVLIAVAAYIRLPKPRGRYPLTGLCRSTLAQMLDDRLIKGVTIRRHGAMRGIRLVLKQSLLDYLAGLAEEQEQK